MVVKLRIVILLLATFTVAKLQIADADTNTSFVEKPDESSLRLPTTLVPKHYLVRLQPFINGNLTINGYVEITFEAKEETNQIVFHILDVITKNDTTKVYQIDDPNTTISIRSQEFDSNRDFYIATLEETLKAGEIYVISLNFEGFLNSNMKGFYLSSYTNDDGNTTFLAVTQFQPTDARRAFPCFDEPAFKAKFTIEMAREEGMNTVSNMPLAETVPFEGQEGWFWDRFNTTYPMSSYLVAFLVSDFVQLEAQSETNYKFGVWARENVISTGEFAVQLGPKVSTFFEDFFNVSFPLPKQDMAAVPDLSFGGMENWGLIIYRESSFLYDPLVASADDKFRIASTISHELAHQWFGDLVTPSWWTDLWLNEGFASYMEYIGLRETAPELRPLDQIVVTDLHTAFALDSLKSSHPISIPVHNPDEINSIFDSISYMKGCSIIRMMSSFLSEDVFRRGLTNYLTELSYSNAEQDDLWGYLTEQGHTEGTLGTDLTVKEIMETWTLQMGYPLLTVQRNGDGSFTLSQERFTLEVNNTSSSSDPHDYKWWIPITYSTQYETSFDELAPRAWMSPEESTKTIENVYQSPTDWVIFNVQQTGFYRVNYDLDNWDAIAGQLSADPAVFPLNNRAQIIDDVLNLARIGKVTYDIALNLLTYLRVETEYAPIKAALNNFDYLNKMMSHKGGYGIFRKYLLTLIVPLYEAVTFEDSLNDPHLDQRKRADILIWACGLGHPPCVDTAVYLFDLWMKNPQDAKIISPNVKSTVYCTAIKEGGIEEWKFAWDQYLATSSGTEQKELLQALGCTKDVGLLARFLNQTLTPGSGIKKQMVRYIFPAVAKQDIGKFVAWSFLRNNWKQIIDYFGSAAFALDDILESVTASLNTESSIRDMDSFRETYAGQFSSATRAVEQAAETVRNNRIWVDNYYDVIIQWLNDNGYEDDF